MVIPNKVFQILLSGKPVITRDSPAIRELCKSADQHAITLVLAGNANQLTEAIRQMGEGSLALASDAEYQQNFECISPDAIGKALLPLFQALNRKAIS